SRKVYGCKQAISHIMIVFLTMWDYVALQSNETEQLNNVDKAIHQAK
ncbi:MAG: hypothetical protein RJA46_254, partial [Pseudomonadota bacterium]